jgi:hypothetical protein
MFLECFLTVQLSTRRLKWAMILGYVFVHVQSISVHGGITITSLFIMIMDAWWVPMTPQELLQHLRSEGDSTHTAISIYLET